MKQILLTIITFFCLNNLLAQSHNLQAGSACKLSKNRCVSTEGCLACDACNKREEENKAAKKAEDQKRIDEKELFGALAVDRSNGFYYGWAYDYTSRAEAEKRAVEECQKRGGNCSVVLSFVGSGCAAYCTINGKVGTAYGWGLAKTKEEADAIATKECMKRSKGTFPANYVWSCNTFNLRAVKELYNAKDEISELVDTLPLGSVHAIAFSKDGRKFATGSRNGIIRIWAMPAFSLTALIHADQGKPSYDNEVKDLVFSPDGKLIVCGQGRKVKVWDALTGKLITILDKGCDDYPALSFSADGSLLASGGDCRWDDGSKSCPGEIYIWDAATWALNTTFYGHKNNMHSTSFSPDGKTLASSSIDGTVIFWDIATGNKKRMLTVAINNCQYTACGQVSKGVYAPDGATFVTITWDINPVIKLWDAANGNLIRTLPGHGTFGESIAYFNSNTKVVSVGSQSGKQTLILWDLNTGAQLATTELDYSDWTVAVSPDGTIATAGVSGVQVWQYDGDGHLTQLKQIRSEQINK